MRLVVSKITHHNCPVQLREAVALTAEQRQQLLRKMHTEPAVSEAAILQTCNRLEFYLYARKSFDCLGYVCDLIGQDRPEAVEVWRQYGQELSELEAARHLFEVAAGLDSQILGENQILAQVKSAYTESLNCRMSKLIFHRLFHNAFRVGKQVRTQTNINCGAVSVALVAVEFARRHVQLDQAEGVVIGAGENAELLAKYLTKFGIKRLVIANRTVDSARELAERLGLGEVIGLEQVLERLMDADLVVSSTSADEPVLRWDSAEVVLKRRDKPLLILDVAVPRDVDPRIGDCPQVTLVNIDQLQQQVIANAAEREKEVPKAQAIVERFTEEFARWYRSLEVVPVISELTRKGMELARNEAKRYASDFGPEHREKLQVFAESLVRKLLHGPIRFVKASGGGDGELSTEQLQAVDLINKMFLSDSQEY